MPDNNPFTVDVDDHELLLHVLDHYHRALLDSPKALTYLDKRGLRSPELVTQFRLGYCDRTLGPRLPPKDRKAGEELRQRLVDIGVLLPSGHERFRGSIVVPVPDGTGTVAQAYGRKCGERLRPGTALHTRLADERRTVWNIEALLTSSAVVVTDSVTDALSWWCAGVRNVIAVSVDDGDAAELADRVAEYRTARVLLATKREISTAALAATGVDIVRVELPDCEDANDVLRQRGPAALVALARAAQWNEIPTTTTARVEAAPVEPMVEPSPELPVIVETDAVPLPRAVDEGRDEVTILHGDRRWRVRGLSKNLSFSALKVNIMVARVAPGEEPLPGEMFHIDTLDLYLARQRNAFAKVAAEELAVKERVVQRDLGRVILALEELVERRIRDELGARACPEELRITEPEREAALALLRSPDLLDRVLGDFARCGVVGEETNKLVAYLVTVSRKLPQPLGAMVQSSSAAGKSSLMEAVLRFVPPEDRMQLSALSARSLFYVREGALAGKVLAIAEDQGTGAAGYSIKLLQSEGALTIASTGKEAKSGRIVTETYHVQGPVALLFTTTAESIDAELANRCLVLAVDEDREQTRAIHRLQRQRATLAGLLDEQGVDAVARLHQNAQRLLRPLRVVNPFAGQLTFRDDRTRCRRDFPKYLRLIASVALLRQHQRDVRQVVCDGETVGYIEVEPDDIAVANRLAHQILGRSLDELAPQTRRLLSQLDDLVAAECAHLGVARTECRFTRRQLRERLGWSYNQLRVHLGRLVELEYVLAHRGGRGARHLYELVYSGEGREGQPFVMGLVDPDQLVNPTTTTDRVGRLSPEDGPEMPVECGAETGGIASGDAGVAANRVGSREKRHRGAARTTRSSNSESEVG